MDDQDIYESLRQQALTVTADELGLVKRPHDPFGVLMETGYPNGTATLAAFGEGSASLYFSSGGGIIGGGRHAAVREVALDLVDLSRQFLEHMDPVSSVATDSSLVDADDVVNDRLGPDASVASDSPVVVAGDGVNDRLGPVAAHPLPPAGKVAFTVLTPSGAWSITEDEQDLGHNRSELAPLFYAGHAVITELRLIAESTPAESPSPRLDDGATED